MSEKKLALQPGYAALTACVGAAAGLIGSVLSDEISAVPPFIWLLAVSPDALGGLGLYFPAAMFLIGLLALLWQKLSELPAEEDPPVAIPSTLR